MTKPKSKAKSGSKPTGRPKIAVRRSTRWMDPEGYRIAESKGWLADYRVIQRFEKELEARIKQGATVAEAAYDIGAALQTAIGNVQYSQVQKSAKRKSAKRRGASMTEWPDQC